jgi:hypothetical protein
MRPPWKIVAAVAVMMALAACGFRYFYGVSAKACNDPTVPDATEAAYRNGCLEGASECPAWCWKHFQDDDCETDGCHKCVAALEDHCADIPDNAANKVGKKTERDGHCIAELKTQMTECKDSKEARNSWMAMGFGTSVTAATCLAICAATLRVKQLQNSENDDTTECKCDDTKSDKKSDTNSDTNSDTDDMQRRLKIIHDLSK